MAMNPRIYESTSPLTVTFNPNVLTDATVTVTVGYTFLSGPPIILAQTQVTSPTVSFDLSGEAMDDPQGIAIKIAIQPNSAPPGQEPLTILKEYFASVTQAGFR